MRALPALLILAGLALPAPAAAQGSPFWVKYGKWGLLATAVGLNLLGADAHRDANRTFDQLENRCSDTPRFCALNGNSGYVDAESERLFQETLDHDRSARRWLIAGESALLGAAAMFVWEFTRPSGVPDDNIPFAPRVQGLQDGVGVGFELRF